MLQMILVGTSNTVDDATDYISLLFYVNNITRVYRLYIPPVMAKDVIKIVHK